MDDELLTTQEAARLLRCEPKTLRRKVAAGLLVENVHFYKPEGMQFRWIKAGLLAYLRGEVSKKPGVTLRLASAR